MTTADTSVVGRLGGEAFLARVFGREFRIARGDATTVAGLLGWEDVNAVLARHRLEPPRLRLCSGGKMLPQHLYTRPVTTRRNTVWNRIQPAALHEQLAAGATLVLDAADELHAGIGELAAQLERGFRTAVQANLYASWTANEGFGTHWDDHDVVVVQVDGAKRWRLYGPTRVAPMHRDVEAPEAPPDEPIADLVLTPGDTLYVPRGWWHAVAAENGGRSLHLTFGLQSTTGADLIGWLADTLRTHQAVRADVPRLGSAQQKRDFADTLLKLVTAELEAEGVVDRYAEFRDATEQPRQGTSLPYVDSVPPSPGLPVRLLVSRASVTRDPDDRVVLTAGGGEFIFAPQVYGMLALLLDGRSQRLGKLAQASGVRVEQAAAVVTELVAGQVAHVGTVTT
ncbi:cupin domain-containing protein [Streptomyces sp. SID3343]|uniref:JmjC domain-containing protein n=1 Tax=Streptomyces sp. SID3343 TaxID=2690260 RepID=UPI001369BB06|nr:cupin domain-containing protein [Streptomyces sp. SID3343]MYW03444.1 cupin [Streptomyces sp. SID3343]